MKEIRSHLLEGHHSDILYIFLWKETEYSTFESRVNWKMDIAFRTITLSDKRPLRAIKNFFMKKKIGRNLVWVDFKEFPLHVNVNQRFSHFSKYFYNCTVPKWRTALNRRPKWWLMVLLINKWPVTRLHFFLSGMS